MPRRRHKPMSESAPGRKRYDASKRRTRIPMLLFGPAFSAARRKRKTGWVYLLIPTMLLSLLLPFIRGSAAVGASSALQFNGTNNYVTFGAAPTLGAATFTIETWFRREGTGTTTTTSSAGGGGLTAAIPLLTKGRGEADAGDNRDMNYFLGLQGNVLVADFEEGQGAVSPSQ